MEENVAAASLVLTDSQYEPISCRLLITVKSALIYEMELPYMQSVLAGVHFVAAAVNQVGALDVI